MTSILKAAVGVALAQLESGRPCGAILTEVTRAEAALADHPVSPALAADITTLLVEIRRCAEFGVRSNARLRRAKHRVLIALHTC
jgi:hypothetical protein